MAYQNRKFHVGECVRITGGSSFAGATGIVTQADPLEVHPDQSAIQKGLGGYNWSWLFPLAAVALGASNDDIPADEMLLAEAIANTKAHGIKWTKQVAFRDREGISFSHVPETMDRVGACCALGAVALLNPTPGAYYRTAAAQRLPGDYEVGAVITGNDANCDPDEIMDCRPGVTFGLAFKSAMTDAGDTANQG